jgi:Tfp pilus assembly protein FimT
MATLSPFHFEATRPLARNPQPRIGFSLLDLLVVVFVLTLILLAAVYQFPAYKQEERPAQPIPSLQPTPPAPSS